MNTEFKILWFEDERAWFNGAERRIVSALKEHGLTAAISRKTGIGFDIAEIAGNTYDLIFMDYRLAQGRNGTEIGVAIRNQDIVTDILFYSSQEGQMHAELKEKIPEIDGVYLTKRDQTVFTEKAKRLIDKIVRRSEDIVNLRGFVLDNSSDFEIQITDLLNKSWNVFSEEEQQALTNITIDLLNNSKGRKTKVVEQTKEAENVFSTAVNSKDMALSATDKVELFAEATKILCATYDMNNSTDISEENKKRIARFKKYYTDSLTVYRNKLSHARVGDKFIRINGVDVEINQTLHRLLRSNINDIHDLLDGVERYIGTLE